MRVNVLNGFEKEQTKEDIIVDRYGGAEGCGVFKVFLNNKYLIEKGNYTFSGQKDIGILFYDNNTG